MYFSAEGVGKVMVDGRQVDKVVPGQFFGELALTCTKPRMASVVADDEAVQVFELTRMDFEVISHRFPQLESKIFEIGAKRAAGNGFNCKKMKKVLPCSEFPRK